MNVIGIRAEQKAGHRGATDQHAVTNQKSLANRMLSTHGMKRLTVTTFTPLLRTAGIVRQGAWPIIAIVVSMQSCVVDILGCLVPCIAGQFGDRSRICSTQEAGALAVRWR